MFDFPTNPASGTVVMVPDGSYRVWDSTKWRASPSSSTITTGPFLPIAGGVMSGALSLAGNATSALHAVPLQQLNAAMVGGPFLPLSGGTVSSGPVNISWAQNSSINGYFTALSKISSSLSGVPSSGADQGISVIQMTGDTLDAPAGVVGNYITMHSGGTGTSGNRIGTYIDLHHAGSTLDKTRGYPGMVSGIWAYAYGEGPMGGVPGNGYGQMWGGVISGRLTSGATNWLYCVGLEVNVGVDTGASASIVQGQKIVVQFHKQTSNPSDYYLSFVKQDTATPGLANGIVFGSLDGDWPITATGTMIGTQASTVGGTTPKAAAWGIDFNPVAFSGGLIRGPGFSVDGTGKATTNGISTPTSAVAASRTDLTKHLDINGGQYGLNYISSGHMNVALPASGALEFSSGTTFLGAIDATGLNYMPIGATSGSTGNFTQVAVNATKVLGAQIAGWGTPTGPSRIANFPGASATLVQCSNAIAQIIADLKTHGMLGA